MFQLFHQLVPASNNKMSKLNYFRRMMFLGSANGFDTYLRATTDIFEGYGEKALVNYNEAEGEGYPELEAIFSSELSGLQKNDACRF